MSKAKARTQALQRWRPGGQHPREKGRPHTLALRLPSPGLTTPRAAPHPTCWPQDVEGTRTGQPTKSRASKSSGTGGSGEGTRATTKEQRRVSSLAMGADSHPMAKPQGVELRDGFGIDTEIRPNKNKAIARRAHTRAAVNNTHVAILRFE